MAKKGKSLRQVCENVSPMKQYELDAIGVQVFVHKCMNRLLLARGIKTEKNFSFAFKKCYQEGIITKKCHNSCIIINDAGNYVKHVVVQACQAVELELFIIA